MENEENKNEVICHYENNKEWCEVCPLTRFTGYRHVNGVLHKYYTCAERYCVIKWSKWRNN